MQRTINRRRKDYQTDLEAFSKNNDLHLEICLWPFIVETEVVSTIHTYFQSDIILVLCLCTYLSLNKLFNLTSPLYVSPLQNKVPLLSLEALHHLHIFIFILAIVHVTFCVLTVVFGGLKVSN